MKKKYITVAVILVLFAIVGYFLLSQKSRGSIKSDTKLSARAQEFLNTDERQYSDEWRSTSFDEKFETEVSRTEVNVDDCFSIYIPVLISMHRPEGECGRFFMVKEPKATIVVYQRDSGVSSLDEDTGVTLRRNKTDEYQEQSQTIQGKHFLIFKKKGTTYEKTAMYLENGKLFVLTLVSADDTKMDLYFMQMLNSVKL